jgi:hypothetical protein
MKRRDFFAASALAGMAFGGVARAADSGDSGKEYLELRTYDFETPEQLEAFAKFCVDAATPALNRAGVKPVGLYRFFADDNKKEIERNKVDPENYLRKLFVLLPHKSLESVATLIDRMGEDEAFLSAGEQILMAPKDAPAYSRFESSLLLAFDGMPKLEVPSNKDTRVLQLRIYESHSIERHVKKVAMFNEGGEIAIFRKTGLNPVFFGQTLIGSKLPNLTYMLGFDDVEALEAGWAAFMAHPDWDALKKDEQYKDTVSNITNLILRPVPGSQI